MRTARIGVVARIAGVGVAIVLAVASVAAACVPDPSGVDTTSFTVRNGPGAGSDLPDSLENSQPVTSAKAGDRLWAVGRNMQLPDWPYQIKLVSGSFDVNDKGKCGTSGTPQVVATTTGVGFGLRPSNFDVPFVFDPANVLPGPAHFCALAAWDKTGAGLLSTIVQKMYIYDPKTADSTKTFRNNGFTIV